MSEDTLVAGADLGTVVWVCRFIVMVVSSPERFSPSYRLTVRFSGVVLFSKGSQRSYTLAEQVVTDNDYR